MKHFDARRQNENETLMEYEQALRMLHREGWPTARIEQRDAALKRWFEEGLRSSEMTQFLRLHARDSDFKETVTKADSLLRHRVTRELRKRLRLLMIRVMKRIRLKHLKRATQIGKHFCRFT